jgi:hypothetical protein
MKTAEEIEELDYSQEQHSVIESNDANLDFLCVPCALCGSFF